MNDSVFFLEPGLNGIFGLVMHIIQPGVGQWHTVGNSDEVSGTCQISTLVAGPRVFLQAIPL